LQIWVTTEGERFNHVRESYIRGAGGILLLYSITDRESFENLNSRLTEIKKIAKKGACMILVGTNSDLENERKVSVQEGKDFATSNEMKFIEVSAKNNINVKEAFETLVEDILNTNPNINQEAFKPSLPRPKEKKDGFGFCNVY